MEDRRIFERIATKFPLKFLDPSSGREGEAEVVDVSANGIGFVTDKALTYRTPLEMWLAIPDKHEPFYARGEVIWAKALPETNQQRIGVRLERAEIMGLGRALWLKKRSSF